MSAETFFRVQKRVFIDRGTGAKVPIPLSQPEKKHCGFS